MAQRKQLTQVIGVAMLAIMFGAGSVYAQESAKDATGQTQANKEGRMSPTGQNETSSTKPATSGASESSTSASSADKLSRSDTAMMKQLAVSNMAEIEAAKIALNKSKDEQVRSFAQKMVDDHTAAQSQLKDLAQAKGAQLPQDLDAKHKAEIKKLSALSGDKFDKTYMSKGGVADHRQTHDLLGRIEKQAKDSDLKTLASNLMPKINEHWDMAKQARSGSAATTTGSSGTKGSSASGSSKSSSGKKSGESGSSDMSTPGSGTSK
ncbi:DUF4142 domain-containing protein [Noviherbaspirillum autotrophicum]|uniref:DUF4142 domain-containing protein n=1 Tax=Noviherbaspirillum autotrophicum TaxID=709839 RepID=UPI000AFE8676|nr:DUF4142 domain-containing protein [Noviherbaspirillum autotrophicum]